MSRRLTTLFLAVLMMSAVAAAKPAHAQSGLGNVVITSVDLTNLEIVDDVLRADGTVTGTIAGLPFTTQITNFALQLIPDDPGTEQQECAILNLELAPIHLALLGLHVDTSAICLEITATQGGGLLGNLLCSLAGDLLPDLPAGDVLTGLEGDLEDLLGLLLDYLLCQNLGAAQNNGGSVCTGQCVILALSVGPLDLSLLGLNIRLDDCADGPVLVCVSATRSEGILGSLLCSISGRRLGNLSLTDIAMLVNRTLELGEDGVLSGRDRADLRRLLNRLLR